MHLPIHIKGRTLVFFMVLLFCAVACVRLYPFNQTGELTQGIDDWHRYARYALDIKHNGLCINSEPNAYFAPAGFLYNYFVAASFAVFGETAVPVYFMQYILLALAVVLVYKTFASKLKPITGYLFLLTLTGFALVDVVPHYTQRLLSENLAIFTLAAFFYCFVQGFETNKVRLHYAAAFFLGISILVRPNILVFALLVGLMVLVYAIKHKQLKQATIFLSITFLSAGLLALRNYMVCGKFIFLPTEGMQFGSSVFENVLGVSSLCKKAAFIMGYLGALDPVYSWRLHWTLMWLAYFAYVVVKLRRKQSMQVWEILTHVFIVSYYGVLILVAPNLGIYGYRLLIPATFFVLPFGFLLVDRYLNGRIK